MSLIGQRIGSYVVKQQLGEGGMGAVYLAEHPQIGKRVALKVLHPELAANQDITNRFFHEAKAVNDIGHPNIVDILDFGSSPTAQGNVVYLVMELLSGSTLTGEIEKGPFDAARATRLATQIADALGAAHALGIVHRDLKPDNVMLIQRGREESIKLLDFGIAKVTAGNVSTKTRTGMVMGTPTYMSPEQCDGRGNIDHRTDIYALGIVLYEMLTGRVPFSGSGYGELLVKQMTEAPLPLSALRVGIDAHLERVVLKALQKRPEDRYASMQELANALVEPQRYVQAHGGLSGFLPTPSIASATPSAATVFVHAPAPTTGNPTTLSQSAGQLTPPAMAVLPQGTQLRPRRSKAPLIAALGVVVAAGVGVVVVMGRGSHDTAQSATEPKQEAPQPTQPAQPAQPAQPTQPEPPTQPQPSPRQPAAAAQPTKVKLEVATKPAGAMVALSDDKAHCTTPCTLEVARADAEATLTATLAGFADLKRAVRLNGDQHLDLELAKKSGSRPSSPSHAKPVAKPTSVQPVGDNTLNPFEN